MDAELMFWIEGPSGSSLRRGKLQASRDGSHVLSEADPGVMSRLHMLFSDELSETKDILGKLDDGRAVSMPGAHPDENFTYAVPAAVIDAEGLTRVTELEGIKFRVPGLEIATFKGSFKVLGVTLSVAAKGENIEVLGTIPGVGWHEYLTLTKGSVELLVELWSGKWAGARDVEVFYGGQWCAVLRAVDAVDGSGDSLVPAGMLTGEVVAHWIELASRLGVVPWVARPSRPDLPLEMEPMVVGAALEGYVSTVGEYRKGGLDKSLQREAVEAVRNVLRASTSDAVLDDISSSIEISLQQQGRTLSIIHKSF